MKMKLTSHNVQLSDSYELTIPTKFLTNEGEVQKTIKPKHLKKLLKKQYPYNDFKVVIHNVFRKQIKKITEIGLFYLTVEVTSNNPLKHNFTTEDIKFWVVPDYSNDDS